MASVPDGPPLSIPGWLGDLDPLRKWVESCVRRRSTVEAEEDDWEEEEEDEDDADSSSLEASAQDEVDEDAEDEAEDEEEDEEDEEEDAEEEEEEEEEDDREDINDDDEDEDLTDNSITDDRDLFGDSDPIAVDLYVGGTPNAVSLLSSRRVSLSALSIEDAWIAVWQQIQEYLTYDVDPSRKVVVVQLRAVTYADELDSDLEDDGPREDAILPIHCQFTRAPVQPPKVNASIPFAPPPTIPDRAAVLRPPAATTPGMFSQEYARPGQPESRGPIGITGKVTLPPRETMITTPRAAQPPQQLPQTLNPAPVQAVQAGYSDSNAQGSVIVSLGDLLQLVRSPYEMALGHFREEVAIMRANQTDFLADMRNEKEALHRALRRATDQNAHGDQLRNRAIRSMMRSQANASARVHRSQVRAERAAAEAQSRSERDKLRYQIALARMQAESNVKKATAASKSASTGNESRPTRDRVANKLGDMTERILDKVTDQFLEPALEDPAQLAAMIHNLDPKIRGETLKLLAHGDPDLAEGILKDLDEHLDSVADAPNEDESEEDQRE